MSDTIVELLLLMEHREQSQTFLSHHAWNLAYPRANLNIFKKIRILRNLITTIP